MATEPFSMGEEVRERAWSRRSQIAFVGLAMPVLVFLLLGVPYILAHYVVNRHTRFNYIPPPLGGARALEGHWTDAPVVPVRLVDFGKDWSAFGWIATDDDRTTNVLPTVTGTVSQVFAAVGQTVAKDAPLFAIRKGASETDAQSAEDDIKVAAPAAGVVTRLDVAVGQNVKATKGGTAPLAAAIADLSSIWLVSEIDGSDARGLRADQAVEVRPTALAGKVFQGKILAISPVDPETKRATVRILIENSDGALKLNMLAQYFPSNAADAGSPAAPEGAVLFENGGERVFAMAARDSDPSVSGKLTARSVRIGRIREGMVEVIEGLTPGENVEATDALFIDRAAKGY
jgi:multidrug efflux pump subunit AcrA (membrane-fusion protein)